MILHVISAALSLASGVLIAYNGGWQVCVIACSAILYFNSVALDVELERHRAFGEPHPGKRIVIWIVACILCSIAGGIARALW